MVTETMAKVQHELNSLWGLAIISIIFGGIGMAFSISIGVQNIFPMVQTQTLLFPQAAFVVLGFLAAAVSIRWLVSSAEMLDSADDLRVDYAEQKKSPNEDGLAGLIAKMTGYYRENRPKIKTMMLISRIAGLCFVISGAISSTTALINVTSGVPQADVLIQVIGAAFSFAIAAASFAIPHFFGKYTKIWDYRLEETAKAEKEFRRQMEEV